MKLSVQLHRMSPSNSPPPSHSLLKFIYCLCSHHTFCLVLLYVSLLPCRLIGSIVGGVAFVFFFFIFRKCFFSSKNKVADSSNNHQLQQGMVCIPSVYFYLPQLIFHYSSGLSSSRLSLTHTPLFALTIIVLLFLFNTTCLGES